LLGDQNTKTNDRNVEFTDLLWMEKNYQKLEKNLE
jgi:hypothetical protein